jgi:hypothetical protein
MVKEIWRPASKGSHSVAIADLPALNAADYEYLFVQILEGVAHGWQQPRVVKFFAKLKHRIPKAQWLAWLETYGNQILESANPSEDLARRMIQLGELDCGEITELSGEYGQRILGKIYGGYTEEIFPALEGADGIEIGYIPELSDFGLGELSFEPIDESYENDFAQAELEPLLEMPLPEPEQPVASFDSSPMVSDRPLAIGETASSEQSRFRVTPEPEAISRPPIPNNTPHPLERRSTSPPGWNDDAASLPTFGEVPPELRLSNRKTAAPPPPPPSGFFDAPAPMEETLEQSDDTVEERQISLEEFEVMLRSDPELVQQIAQQLGLETTDPQVVVDAVTAQMKQQMQDSQQS